MENPAHILHSKGFDYKDFFTDVLSNPIPYIEMLRTHNVTAHRFSLEWSVIEPKPGQIDQAAVQLYQQFIQQLLDAGITPSITLSHFVVPKWFYEQGNFLKRENIHHYVKFALDAMHHFPNVQDWWSFNELGIKPFQQAREVYPTDLPEGSSLAQRVHAAGTSTRNMLMAHCLLHQAVTQQYPNNKLGVTHQWLQFDTENNNWLERLVSHTLTNIVFTPVAQFFKTGVYAFQVPFMANIQFEIPPAEFEQNNHFLMRLGVQAYPKPMIKMGLNLGQNYPGVPEAIKNLPIFSFGSTCEPGGTVMRFGPRWKAEAMREILDQAFALTQEVYITEYGADANVQKWGRPRFECTDEAQADYLKQLTLQLEGYTQETGREIKGLFCWSDLRRQLEWENGFACRLGLLNTHVNHDRQMIDWESTPASLYLQEVFQTHVAPSEEAVAT